MRSTTFVAAVSALATLSFAAPTPQTNPPSGEPQCMTKLQAQQVADNFKDLIASYSDDLADTVLSSNFADYSSSVNSIINGGAAGPIPLLQPTFNTLGAFKAGQGGQPHIPFAQLNMWYTCDGTVITRWQSDDPAHGNNDVAQLPVVGNAVLETEYNSAATGAVDRFLITTVYSEFNSAAWLVDLGVFKPKGPITTRDVPTIL